MKWQPIETAPKLKPVIVSDGRYVIQSIYGKVSHVPIYGWLDIFADPENVQKLDWTPTHWMPLPEPPDTDDMDILNTFSPDDFGGDDK